MYLVFDNFHYIVVMLNYHEFQPYEAGNMPLFRFKKLNPIDEHEDLYICPQTDTKYRVSIFHNHHHVALLNALTHKGVFGNIKGFFKRKNMYYCFSEVDSFQTLADIVQRERNNGLFISELFCLQLIESMLQIASLCEEVGCTIKIINPFKLMVKQKNRALSFHLVYPFCHNLLEGLTCEIVKEEAQFCAPQILMLMDNEYDLIRRTFPKAILYSLGLNLLFCFGYRIKSQQRILALKNDKEFTLFLKTIRKEIKSLHEGKFISKLIKTLMQVSDLVRDTLVTFSLKLSSPQFESLRKFVFGQNEQSSADHYIPTICSQHSVKLDKSGLNRTIEIQGSANTNINKTQMSSPENGYRGVNLYSTFKKSPESIFKNNLGQSQRHSFRIKDSIAKSKTKSISSQRSNLTGTPHQIFEEEKVDNEDGTPSPVDIMVDWDQLQKQDPWTSQKRSTGSKERETPYRYPKMNEPLPQIKDEVEQNDPEIMIVVTQARQKPKHDESRRSSVQSQKSQKKQKKKKEKKEQKEDKRALLAPNLDSQLDLKGGPQFSKKNSQQSNQQTSKSFKKKSMALIEEQEQPQIIKYCQQEFVSNFPKSIKKKTSSGSVDLQAMTLIQEQGQEQIAQVQDLIGQSDGRGGTNYAELKEELNKKNQAVFIILLVSFLIYKIVDYLVS